MKSYNKIQLNPSEVSAAAFEAYSDSDFTIYKSIVDDRYIICCGGNVHDVMFDCETVIELDRFLSRFGEV